MFDLYDSEDDFEFVGSTECEYTNTVQGGCMQNTMGYRWCYYHKKVLLGLIEPKRTSDTVKELKEV